MNTHQRQIAYVIQGIKTGKARKALTPAQRKRINKKRRQESKRDA